MIREASTLTLYRGSAGEQRGERCGGDLRADVVDDYGDSKAMVASEDVLEQGSLSASLVYHVRRKLLQYGLGRHTRNPESSVTGSAFTGVCLWREAPCFFVTFFPIVRRAFKRGI